MLHPSNNLLAVEWDRNELSYVWAGNAGRRIVLRAMGRIACGDLAENADAADVMLADLKELLRIKNAQVVVCLSRSEVEEAETTLPPAAEHEVAQLVANEAHKHWPAISDDASIDYYSLEEGGETTKRVSIVVLSSDRKAKIANSVKRVGWKLASIQMRHLAAVGLLRRQVDIANHKQSILLSLSRTDAELIILQKDQIALVRTIHLSTDFDRDSLAEKLSVEIQRSLMVTTRPDLAIEENPQPIFLFGDSQEQQTLADQLGKVLNMPITILNPLQNIGVQPKDLPERIHQFASLLGSILEQPRTQTVDLLDPKCAKPVSNLRHRVMLYSAAALLVIGLTVWSGLSHVSELKNNNLILKKELTAIQKQIVDMQNRTAVVQYVSDWESDDVNWLEELRELSSEFPPRSETQVKSMSMSIGSNGIGLIAMNLRAKEDRVISKLEQSIRDDFHQVRTNQLSQNESDEEYPWQFGATILVQRRERADFALPKSPDIDAAPTGQSEPPSIIPKAEASTAGSNSK